MQTLNGQRWRGAPQGNDPNPTVGTTGTTSTGTDLDADKENLPDTASGLPLLGLIGLAALAGAATIKAVR